MLMIRFQRIGRKNDPAFRIVVLKKTSGPKAGSYVDLVGTYNPKTKAMTVQADRIKDWVSKGAQISPSVMNLLISKGIMEGKKVAVVSKKSLEKNKKEEIPVVETPEPAEDAPVTQVDEEVVVAEEVPEAVVEKVEEPAQVVA
jgi:small subunit ribosomal protein S16